MEKQRMKKGKRRTGTDVPEGFTLSMAFMDMMPVLFFSGSAILLIRRFPDALFRIGAVLVILAGALKVLWKFIIALAHKNIEPLSLQLRFLMPAGFLLIVISLIADRTAWSFGSVWGHITAFPACIFFIFGIAGLVCMSVFAVKLDRTDAKANWIEQGTNALAQLFIFIGIFLE